jgi:hypothetical protein
MPYGRCNGVCNVKYNHLLAKRNDYVNIGGYYMNGCSRCGACEVFLIPGVDECPCCGNRELKRKPRGTKDREMYIENLVKRY